MRLAVIVLIVLVALVIAGLAAGGWYFSNQFLVPAPYALMPEFEVVAAGDGTVTLPAPPESPSQFARTRVEGAYNLIWDGGYGRLGRILADDGETVTRELQVVAGRSPEPGDPARLDVYVFRRDPLRDHGISFQELALEGEAGDLAAWWIPGASDAAVLLVHGRRRADLTETLRIIPTLVDMGYGVLALSWRNHDASAPSVDGLYRYGAVEYRDALTGLTYLGDQGVQRVALYGFSTGATIALEAAERWPSGPPALEAMVLDAPLIDLEASVRASARRRGLPDLLSTAALAVARLRTGVRWTEIDQRSNADDIGVPLLVFAGTADGTIPIEVVDEFVAAVEAPVTYERLEGVEHVEAWNADPEAYEAAVRAFLDDVMPPR